MNHRFAETTIPCCVCGARAAYAWRRAGDHILGGPRSFSAVRCARCGTARLDPRPDDAEMRRHYTPMTYARAEDDAASGLADRLDEYNRRLAERAVESVGGAPKRALDVGCGDGRFLAAMAARGFLVEGLETDPVAAELAHKRTGGMVHEAFLENAVSGGSIAGGFGLISLLHVLEHVPDPRATLAAAYSLLAPGGVLLIAVPNAGSWEAILFRSAWYPLDLPRHFWGFTPHSLVRLVETCAFDVRGVRHFPFLFAPQSLRYTRRAIEGKPIGEGQPEHGDSSAKNERGGLRTKAFVALLSGSEKLGRHLPGEVMELTAMKPAAGNDAA